MQTAAIALIVVLLVVMACGLEITWALGLSCIVAVLLDPKLTFVVIAQRIFANSNSFSMLAIPAFMLAGDVMSKGGLSKRLVAFADSLVFHPLINSTFWRAMYQQLFLLIHQCHQDCISNGTQSVLHLFLQNICRYDS